MYLKSIEIQGFKSFADKIKLNFKSGITGIVGPNGSGKSNVSDAVRWVLGEQSARELRGTSMQDVIFSGTENRKKLGSASVSICLDNSDKALPVDFDEVVVTRRVYRSGSSEYLMNGNLCRLKDIEELFFDTGIGQDGYSIIGQGQIDRILSGKADERRELFDEAAGIVKFKRRKAQTVKQLEEEKTHLTRVNDIISGLEERIEPVRAQAETARSYLEKKEEQKALDTKVFILDLERIDRDEKELEQTKHEAETLYFDAGKEYEENNLKYSELGDVLSELEIEVEKKRTEINNSSVYLGRLQGEINVTQEKINSIKNSDDHFKERIARVEKERTQDEAERNSVYEKLSSISDAITKATELAKEHEKELDSRNSKLSSVSERMDRNKNSLIDLLNRRSETQSKITQYDTMLQQAEIRKAELHGRLVRSKTDEESLQSDIDKRLNELEGLNSKIKSNDALIQQCSDRNDEINSELDRLKVRHHDLEIEYHEKKSRLESLRNMKEHYEGYAGAVRRVMEKAKEIKGIHGVVADLIKVDARYEVAIETALGGAIQNVVTDSEATAHALIDILKRERAGRATFLPLDSIQPRELISADIITEKGAIGSADRLVSFDKRFEAAVRNLLGGFLIVDNIDNASAIARKYRFRQRIVTLEGESLNPGGSISGGAFRNKSNLLGRSREIDSFNAAMKEILKNIDSVLERIEELRHERRDNDEASRAAKDQQGKYNVERTAALTELKNLENRLNESKSGVSGIEREEKELILQIQGYEDRKKNEQDLLQESEEEEKRIRAEIEEDNLSLGEGSDGIDDLRALVTSEREKCAGLLQQQESYKKDLNRLKNAISQEEDELAQNRQRVAQNAVEIAAKLKEIEEKKALIDNSGEADQGKKEELAALLKEKEEKQALRNELYKESQRLSEKRSSAEREIDRLNGRCEKLSDEENKLVTYMWDEYELTRKTAADAVSAAGWVLSKDEAPAMKKRISELKSEIRALGSVNVNAIEEHREVMEKYDFLISQRDDILNAEEDLKKIIADLNSQMENQFREKFDEIQKQYDRVFKELFGGGMGRLELVNADLLLTTDIRIIAEPPGKKLQNMLQLSGGEKALSAIALLFAIQNLKPSPFCLLDEIEAALDEANVDRFAEYLTRMTDNTQFIVITHRRGTMMAADRLYGITMQEKGVSTQVNVSLEGIGEDSIEFSPLGEKDDGDGAGEKHGAIAAAG